MKALLTKIIGIVFALAVIGTAALLIGSSIAAPTWKHTLIYNGDGYTVSVGYNDDASIPDGSYLSVRELEYGTDEYQQYLNAAYVSVASLQNDDQSIVAIVGTGDASAARFFDVSIYDGGLKVEPSAEVQVSIAYDEAMAGEGDSQYAMLHYDEGDNVPEITKQDNSQFFTEKQSSFSVVGTVTLGPSFTPELSGDNETVQDWFCGNSAVRTLNVFATFSPENAEKTITIKIPHGYKIVSCSSSAKDSNIDSFVTPITIDGEYTEQVIKSEIGPSTLTSKINGVVEGSTYDAQYMEGYTSSYSSAVRNIRVYGGDITYTLAPSTQTVNLVCSLYIMQEQLTHNSSTENMDDIVIECTEGSDTQTTPVHIRATSIPGVGIGYCSGTAGPSKYNIAETSSVENRTDFCPMGMATSCYLGSTAQSGAYYDEMTLTLTYPEGVFYDAGTLFCNFVGGTLKQSDGSALAYGTRNTVIDDHCYVTINEAATGGGTITIELYKGVWSHSSSGASFGCHLRGNNNKDLGAAYYTPDNKTINGISFSIPSYTRNGSTFSLGSLSPVFTLISTGNGKDVVIWGMNTTRRDITSDFDTDKFDYSIGGFYLQPALPYTDNVLWFENTCDHKITQLQFLGKNVRNITVVTNTGRIITIDSLGASGSQYNGAVLSKSRMGLTDDEYVKRCLYTSDYEQLTYYPTHEFGCFVYNGQFVDGKTGSVSLTQLKDGTTYEAFASALASGTVADVELLNVNENHKNEVITSTDTTKIGWTNSGVGSCSTSIINKASGKAEDAYYANEKITISSTVTSGYSFRTQDMIIDPTIVISFPEGIQLDTSSVLGWSDGGTGGSRNKISLVQKGAATATVINGVTWTTYKFSVSDEDKLKMVTLESTYGNMSMGVSFDAVISSVCPQYNVSLQDVLMWDTRNDSGEEETAATVGAAVNSHWSQTCVRSDSNNFIGNGASYGVANQGTTFVTKPLIGLNADLAIKQVTDPSSTIAADGDYFTYNGLASSIASVIPTKYVDIKMSYESTSTSDYFQGTVIYQPVPKKDINYSKIFENIELSDPINVSQTFDKSRKFDLSLTGPVELLSSNTTGTPGVDAGATKWITYYAVAVTEATTDAADTPYVDGKDAWEPVTATWLTEDQISDWSKVVMMKFVAQDNVSSGETGTALMRAYVQGVEEGDLSFGNRIDYWRAYTKAVTNASTCAGNWKYSSIIAATPALETIVGQVFTDPDGSGSYNTGDAAYAPSTISAVLSRDDKTLENVILSVGIDGKFELQNADGTTRYLTAGDYTLTVKKPSDDYRFSNVDVPMYNVSGAQISATSIGKESPSNCYYNNGTGTEATATWKVTVVNNSQDSSLVVHRVGISVVPSEFYELLSIPVTKVWNDDSNRDGARPTSVSVTLTSSTGKTYDANITGSDWEYTFTDIPSYENGKKLSYSLSEDTVAKYASVVSGSTTDGFIVTNSYTPQKTSVTVSKIWDDDDDRDGLRPDTISYTLSGDDSSTYYKNGTDADGWTVIFTDLYVYDHGKEINYSLSEATVDEYSTDIAQDGYSFTVTNSHSPALLDIPVTKTWVDDSNRDGVRPSKVTTVLSGSDGTSHNLDIFSVEGNTWTGEYTSLPVYYNHGKEIVYRLKENDISSYASTVEGDKTGFIVTNTHELEKTSVSGKKIWNDDDNRDGIRPDKVTIILYGNGDEVARQEVTGSGSTWNYAFTNLLKKENGHDIKYTVGEETVDRYLTSIDGTTITNTHDIETTYRTVVKKWDDSLNQDGKRPENITVTLKGSDSSSRTKTIAATDSWTGLFADLPVHYNNGKTITYTIEENAISGYTMSAPVYDDKWINITNVHQPETTSIKVIKKWDDNNNQDGRRSTSVSYVISSNSGYYHEGALTENGNWTDIVSSLPVYKDGKAITYSVAEKDGNEWYEHAVTSSGSNTAGWTYTLTNTHVPATTSVTINKVWNDDDNRDGIRPDAIDFTVTGSNGYSNMISLTADDGWTATVKDLPAFSSQSIITYMIEETETEGYISTYDVSGSWSEGYSFSCVNEHMIDTTTIPVNIVWKDHDDVDKYRPDSVHLILTGSDGSTRKMELDSSVNWHGEFVDLPVHYNGEEIEYTLEEDPMYSYGIEVEKNEDGSFTATNSHDPDKITLTAEKKWNGDENDSSARGPITVTLMANGKAVAEQTLSQDNDWKCDFSDLDQRIDGVDIEYTLAENPFAGYQQSVEKFDGGFTVINTKEPVIEEEPVLPTTTIAATGNNMVFGMICGILLVIAASVAVTVARRRRK